MPYVPKDKENSLFVSLSLCLVKGQSERKKKIEEENKYLVEKKNEGKEKMDEKKMGSQKMSAPKLERK